MASDPELQSSLQMSQGQERSSYLTTKDYPHSLSDTTEIFDSDPESDSQDDYSTLSPQRSIRSARSLTDSATTASTPDEIKTPNSTGLTGFHFHFDENPVAGPMGPHLFLTSEEKSLEVEVIFEDTPISATTPRYTSASKLGPERRDTPVPQNNTKQPKQPSQSYPETGAVDQNPSEFDAAHWTPQDVVTWMQNLGFEDSIVEKFFINDISGSILLELQVEDLKELDIQSFGKRHQLMNSIRHLRNSVSISICDDQSDLDPNCREDTATPRTTAAEVGSSCNASPVTDEERLASTTRQHRPRRHHKHRNGSDIVPEDSVSIVAIEQLLPRVHTCSKGENCRKWQKQQVKLSRMVSPIEVYGGSVVITGDPGNAATAPAIAKTPKSEVTPSIVASSDALGPNQINEIQLSRDKLEVVRPRDPQENVRNFVNFQRLSRLQPVTDPATPPREHFPSPESDSPGSTKTLAENLRHLPRLRIPSTQNSFTSSTLSPNYSAQRTITPSILRRKQLFNHQSTQASPDPLTVIASPSDFYREDPIYGRSTPFSEVDVPVTVIPMGPVSRYFSQSVPPNMRFGGPNHHMADLIPRPTSTKAENHRRNPSFLSSPNVPALSRLNEGEAWEPIDTLEDLDRTPRAAHCKNDPFSPTGFYVNDIMHSGWMKKRKTTRLLRHEWEEHHFTLKGTQLAMYTDEEASCQDSKALEYIDIDDYAVACSSIASSSKLTAAFKKTMLKRKDNIQGEAAFAFSLIPTPNNGADRKSIFTQGPKVHHFAVKTREERIDWMRELMLAKALRRGRESGASVNLNGATI